MASPKDVSSKILVAGNTVTAATNPGSAAVPSNPGKIYIVAAWSVGAGTISLTGAGDIVLGAATAVSFSSPVECTVAACDSETSIAYYSTGGAATVS